MNKYQKQRKEIKSIRFANRIAKSEIKTILSSTSIVCNMLQNGKHVRALLGTQAAHAQFYSRYYYD